LYTYHHTGCVGNHDNSHSNVVHVRMCQVYWNGESSHWQLPRI